MLSLALDWQRRYWTTVGQMLDMTPPEWTTPNRIVYTTPQMYLRTFGGNGPALVIDTPQAGHSSHIADYGPGQSLVQAALGAGYSVYVTDKRSATYDRRDETIADVIRALDDCVMSIGAPVTLAGLCQGGWEATIYAALHPERVERLILAGSPLDFDAGDGFIKGFAQFTPWAFFEGLVTMGAGLLDGRWLLGGFMAMHPERHFIERPLSLLLHADDPLWLARDRQLYNWYLHTQMIPGRWYLEVVDSLFRRNLLVKGELSIDGQLVELGNIRCPVTMVAGTRDDITPPIQMVAAAHLFRDAEERYLIDAGHVGLFMGKEALRDVWPGILGQRARVAA